jgi:hypothetical protein
MQKKTKKKQEENLQEIAEFLVDTKRWSASVPLHLDLSGIYFVAAYKSYLEGLTKYNKLSIELDKYHHFYQSRLNLFPKDTNEFSQPLFKKIRRIEHFYEPVIRCFSTSKILLVCCIESYINVVASAAINGKKQDEFDKLSIMGKWLIIQDIIKIKRKFGLDSFPLQGISQLIADRNKLVHFKGLKTSLNSLEIPKFIESLKLNPNECEQNIKAVQLLIKTFSLGWRGSSGPYWLNFNQDDYRNPCFYLGRVDAALIMGPKHIKG